MNQKIVELKERTRKQIILQKAQKIVDEGKVNKVGPNHWRVQASSDKTLGLMYDVVFDTSLDALTCSCLHFEHKSEYCKHILSAAIFFGKEDVSMLRRIYLGLIGNVFHTKDIDAAIEKGKKFQVEVNSYTDKAVGLDPGFGSSNFGVCITEVRDGIVNVLHAEEYQRPDYNTMIQTTISLLDKYGITRESGCRIYTDGSNSAFTSSLKRAVYEDPDYTRQIEYLKKTKPSIFDFEYLKQCMFVLPVHFSKEHKAMLAHCKEVLENSNGMIAINPKFTKLVTALRTAVENGEGALDKEATSHDDLFDAFRMSLMHWRRQRR